LVVSKVLQKQCIGFVVFWGLCLGGECGACAKKSRHVQSANIYLQSAPNRFQSTCMHNHIERLKSKIREMEVTTLANEARLKASEDRLEHQQRTIDGNAVLLQTLQTQHTNAQAEHADAPPISKQVRNIVEVRTEIDSAVEAIAWRVDLTVTGALARQPSSADTQQGFSSVVSSASSDSCSMPPGFITLAASK
jgi:hypothetical protein